MYSDITPRVLDAITVDLDIGPAYLLKSASLMEWPPDDSSRGGFCARIDSLVEEYRAARDLRPLRLIVLGPPASGKTILASQLARHYRLHYVSLESLVDDTIRQLVSFAWVGGIFVVYSLLVENLPGGISVATV